MVRNVPFSLYFYDFLKSIICEFLKINNNKKEKEDVKNMWSYRRVTLVGSTDGAPLNHCHVSFSSIYSYFQCLNIHNNFIKTQKKLTEKSYELLVTFSSSFKLRNIILNYKINQKNFKLNYVRVS